MEVVNALNKRVIVAFFGDQASRAAVQHWSASADVVAVALDLGGAMPLNELRDGAIAAGAIRCHALDVREEFAREALLPAVRSRVFADTSEAFRVMAVEFVARKVADIAAIEQAAVVPTTAVTATARVVRPAVVKPKHLQIDFEDGVPVAVNGIPMSLTELMESVETITGESALAVLQREYAGAAA